MKFFQLSQAPTVKHRFRHLGKLMGPTGQMHTIRISLCNFKPFSSCNHVRGRIVNKQADIRLINMKISTHTVNGITHSHDVHLIRKFEVKMEHQLSCTFQLEDFGQQEHIDRQLVLLVCSGVIKFINKNYNKMFSFLRIQGKTGLWMHFLVTHSLSKILGYVL